MTRVCAIPVTQRRAGWAGWAGRAGGTSDTVAVAPQTSGADGLSGSAFQKHSRTVIVLAAVSIAATWNDSLRSSVADTCPFIGESARKTLSEAVPSGPRHV